MDTSTHDNIEAFVRGPLGCNCSDKVFENIEFIDSFDNFKPVLGGTLFSTSKLISIGGILLILTVQADSVTIQGQLEAIFKCAIEMRDRLGFNRFRLVLACADPEKEARILESQFNSFVGDEEKIHLHVISSEQLPLYSAEA